MSDNPQQYAQGGQNDVNREQPKGDYQQGQEQGPSTQKQRPHSDQAAVPGNNPQRYAQGGQDDANREQPKGDYQQG